ncbi:hypothetical protein [Microcoleus sp. CAWBG58]|uniref:hypothetical protein n=1 Tax=Microcoleus sp. CAWBG58 TaxID=2841651 RepID=UPI0025E2AB2E|nr:hypothetical protein [Microcoleus sp. CAWBG58]
MNFDLQQLIKTFGYLGIWAIVLAESGLLFVFFCRETACYLLRALWRRGQTL